GSICLWDPETETLFSGDAAYVDAKLGWEDPAAFGTSLRRLRDLGARIVHSGHGRSFDGTELRETIDRGLRELSFPPLPPAPAHRRPPATPGSPTTDGRRTA